MAAFGRFIDRTLGPFKPGLNVVYGPNEAGKTTARAFVGGVLFGWPEARGSRNAYKPRAASREGSLLFCDAATGEVGRVSRARNAEGLIGDEAWLAAVCGDIDRETEGRLRHHVHAAVRADRAEVGVQPVDVEVGAGARAVARLDDEGVG